MTPNLLFYPVFDIAEALAGVTDCKVLHPPAQDRVDQLHHPVSRLRLEASEHVFELAQERRSLLQLGRVVPRASRTWREPEAR